VTNPVSGGFQFTPATGLNDVATYPTTPASETAARQQVMDLYWQLMNEMNKPTLSAAAFAQYNKLINGGFAINQRVVFGIVTLVAGAYGHDRWKAGAAGCTYTFATVANVTTITITAGSLIQVIEGINLYSGTHALSWTGTSQGKIGAGAFGASGITGAAVGGANLSIEFNVGTLSKVMFNVGDQALPFQPRSFDEEKRLCERYFQIFNSADANTVYMLYASGFCFSTTRASILINYNKMRISPTITFSSVGQYALYNAIGAPVVATAISISEKTPYSAEIFVTVASGLIAGNGTMFMPNNNNTSTITFDAEI
jgi:hypothetical protein